MVFKDLNRKFQLVLGLIILAALPAWANLNFIKDNTLFQSAAIEVKPELDLVDWDKVIENNKSWDEQIDYDSGKFSVNYTFQEELEDFIKKQLKTYHPDYTSVVVMDNETGKILAAVDYARATKKFGRDLAFTNTHPAASIIKVITASDLLENTHIKTDTEFSFTGKSTTLYKHQLKEPANRRWIRSLDFQKAFATSNNVIFGRTAIDNLTPAGLKKMAEKFGFNKKLVEGVDVEPSVFELADSRYNLAELSSGLNRQTLMSPVHGAVIASVVANGGVLRYPVVIESLKAFDDERLIYPPIRKDEQILTPATADDLRTLFMSTVTKGTARSSFRRSKYLLDKLEIGGKTGSLTGGKPFGKRDWFISYAKSTEHKTDKGISICVMIVNQKKWYIKSPFLTKNIIEYYYSTIYPQKD
jgi:peptidoglycan glycosyltransferase